LGVEPTYLICAGAAKSGTTWAYRQLRAHPECHFRSIKELHYFDMTRPEHFALAQERLAGWIAALEEEMQAGDPLTLAGKAEELGDLWDWAEVVGRGEIDLPAYRDYLLGGRDGQAVVGEVTPAYAMLPVERLQRMAGVGHPFRLLFLMRDPVARAWSHIRMVAARAGAAFEATARALLARLVAGEGAGAASDDLAGVVRGIARRGDYRSILGRLKAAFPADALHLEFTERLTAPSGLDRLWGFLGIGPGLEASAAPVYESPALDLREAESGALRRWLRP
jgi:hypothetical protein